MTEPSAVRTSFRLPNIYQALKSALQLLSGPERGVFHHPYPPSAVRQLEQGQPAVVTDQPTP